ncbi:hypothetical protein H7Q97_14425 [Ochrobactrum sp. CM-21-5]|nr:hypothetical protein [Ochrobactrum sp. CM-21-5]MBC2886586.1 hypothetical protein [Ochrobactrum sp. CM-21-5]
MTYVITPTLSNSPYFVNDRLIFKCTITWDAGDADLTSLDTLQLEAGAADSATFTTAAGGSLPLTLVPTLRTHSASYTVSLVAKTAGDATLSITPPQNAGLKQSLPKVNVFPQDTQLISSGFDKGLMQVAQNNDLTPGTASPDQIAKLTVKAIEKSTGKPVGNVPVTFVLSNVNINPSLLGGKFYNGSKQLIPKYISGGNAIVSINTEDATGIAVLSVVANANPAFISCTPEGATFNASAATLFLVDSTVDRTLGSPQVFLPSNPSGIFDITNIKSEKFNIRIQAKNTDRFSIGEYVALVLNDKLQSKVDAGQLKNGPLDLSANISDLNSAPSPTGKDNIVYYALSSDGAELNGPRLGFAVVNDGGTPNPLPKNPIVGPISSPTGGTINSFTLTQDLPVRIPIKNDREILKGKSIPDLAPTNGIKITINLEGFSSDKNGPDSASTTVNALVNISTDEQTVTVPSSLFTGWGRNPKGTITSTYTIWYSYTDTLGSDTIIAESKTINGPINTINP